MNKKEEYLCSMINELCHNSSSQKIDDFLITMLQLMAQEYDLTYVAGSAVKLLAMQNVLLKKIVCMYLIRYSENVSNLNILATNSLMKDFKDPNPQVRRLALKTVCSIPCLSDLSLELLPYALVDSSAYVRKTASSCCAAVINLHNVNSCINIIDLLYQIIRDPDPSVVTNAILALDKILEAEGGIVINFKMFQYLVARITHFPDYCLAAVCSVLNKYKVKDENDSIYMLNALDDELISKNPVVFISVAQLALNLCNTHNQHLIKDIIERILCQLNRFLCNSSGEMLYVVLEWVEKLVASYSDIFTVHYKNFLIHFNDTEYIKIKKLKILSYLVNNDSIADIMEDILFLCTDELKISNAAACSFTFILKMHFSLCQPYLKSILQLMSLNNNNLCEEIIKQFNILNPDQLHELDKSFLTDLIECFNKINTVCGKKALIHFIGRFGKYIRSSPYILEELFGMEENMADENIMLSLTLSAVKLFYFYPVKMHILLGQILQTGRNSESVIVQKQALFYYNLLKADKNCVEKLVNIYEGKT